MRVAAQQAPQPFCCGNALLINQNVPAVSCTVRTHAVRIRTAGGANSRPSVSSYLQRKLLPPENWRWQAAGPEGGRVAPPLPSTCSTDGEGITGVA